MNAQGTKNQKAMDKKEKKPIFTSESVNLDLGNRQ